MIAVLENEDVERWMSGSCTEFALALAKTFESAGIASKILIGQRVEIDLKDEDPLPLTSYSHAVVEANGTTWDAAGSGALDRWEAMWANEETEFQTESEFTWIEVPYNANAWSTVRRAVEDLGGSKPNADDYNDALQFIENRRDLFFRQNEEASIKEKARNIVHLVSEDEDESDFEAKDVHYDQLAMAVQALEKAGFKIIRAAHLPNSYMNIQFSWPAITTMTHVSGWRRAKEVLAPLMKLRQDNYHVVKPDHYGPESVSMASIYKRMEEDPNVWKLEPVPEGGATWQTILFKGQNVGAAYFSSYGPVADTVERFREELAELNSLVPFVPEKYTDEGNMFGHGPVIDWWRKNRRVLPNARTTGRYFDPQLINRY